MIAIPTSPNRDANMMGPQGPRGGVVECIVCGKGIENPKFMVNTWLGAYAVTDAEREELLAKEGEGADSGAYPLGTDCLKKHPQLRAYAIKAR